MPEPGLWRLRVPRPSAGGGVRLWWERLVCFLMGHHWETYGGTSWATWSRCKCGKHRKDYFSASGTIESWVE
jgi:hypothetical protein